MKYVVGIGVALLGAGLVLILGGGLGWVVMETGDGSVSLGSEIQEIPVAEVNRVEPTAASVPLTMVVVGDVMLSREVDRRMKMHGDWTWPFATTADKLRQADITMGNLETPVLTGCPVMTNRMVFCAEEESLAGLTEAGFDLVSLANNHSSNQGLSGLVKTEGLLEERGIRGVREGETEVVLVEGLRVGLVVFDDVTKRMADEPLLAQVASAAAMSDMVVVMPHWGVEYVAEPNERQVELGRALIEAGANVVVGAHPHWTQTVEEYGDGVIIYSLGNFVFDQMWSERTRRGVVAELKFQILDDKLQIEHQLLPVRIYDYGQPKWEDN